ncbi:2OG-Fe(II)oxygenase [Colletotrichum karsti]|uniref:2OG-Fe(II)oxygenase n=1 Tax=Colletotrichum karsti TaxID=1095194 RepID=A0A9P6IAX4_9PEZI|nr:2OG-Fe(II)oxygenase [Colletotrichum karsti]KAF9875275.1 2OG-Fe(II)oxygenase [Colletotrichum karsti]
MFWQIFSALAALAAVDAHGLQLNKRSSGLDVTLAAPLTYGSAEVVATIKNAGNTDLNLLKVGTILDSNLPVQRLIVLDDAGSQVPFIGIEPSLRYNALKLGHFQHLAAGESVTVNIDAGKVHRFDKSGTFSFTAEGVIPVALTSSTDFSEPAVAFKSNTVTLEVNANTASVSLITSALGERTNLQPGCNETTLEVSVKALANCQNLALAAAADASDSSSKRFVEYFGTNSSDTRNIVATRLRNVAQECSTTDSGVSRFFCYDYYGWSLMSVEATIPEPETTVLRFASGNGPVTRRILRKPLRDALPTEIPIIDISPSFSEDIDDRKGVAQQIRKAATTSGFFYIINHGIDSSITDSAHEACLHYFRQDEEDKMRSWVGKSRYFNGYKPPGSQRINKSESIDVRETFSWTYDPRHDPDVDDVVSIPEDARRFLRIEDFHWEGASNQPNFQNSIIRYWQSCLKLARVLVRAFALSLDLPEEHFDAKFKYPDAALALNYYPPLSKTSQATLSNGDAQVSIGSHTDFQLFTILWQDAVGGLQVLNRQGQWIRAAPLPGTFVVNIADYLQRITNDLYVSTVHRAQNLSGQERISMPFFFGFGLHESCGVVETCVKDGEKPKYEEIGCEAWVQRRAKAMHRVESDGEADA